jgi:hypothetical protein
LKLFIDAQASTPEARLYRKGPGKEAKLCFMGHALMENRNGLIIGNFVSHWATGQPQAFSAPALLGVMQAIRGRVHLQGLVLRRFKDSGCRRGL